MSGLGHGRCRGQAQIGRREAGSWFYRSHVQPQQGDCDHQAWEEAKATGFTVGRCRSEATVCVLESGAHDGMRWIGPLVHPFIHPSRATRCGCTGFSLSEGARVDQTPAHVCSLSLTQWVCSALLSAFKSWLQHGNSLDEWLGVIGGVGCMECQGPGFPVSMGLATLKKLLLEAGRSEEALSDLETVGRLACLPLVAWTYSLGSSSISLPLAFPI